RNSDRSPRGERPARGSKGPGPKGTGRSAKPGGRPSRGRDEDSDQGRGKNARPFRERDDRDVPKEGRATGPRRPAGPKGPARGEDRRGPARGDDRRGPAKGEDTRGPARGPRRDDRRGPAAGGAGRPPKPWKTRSRDERTFREGDPLSR